MSGSIFSSLINASGSGGGVAVKATGQAVLVAGTVTVLSAFASATATILLTVDIQGGVVGDVQVGTGTIVNGVSFDINSSSSADTSTVGWTIL